MPVDYGFSILTLPRPRLLRLRLSLLILAAMLISVGCASTSSKWVSLRNTPRNPLTETLSLVARTGPQATPRTLQLLRRYDLDPNKVHDGNELIAELNKIDRSDPSREHLYALAELAYVGAKRAERSKHQGRALELYGSSVLYSYRYLFDPDYPVASNPYDPQFRRACDLYNSALEDTLRIVQRQQRLQPNTSRIIKTASHDCKIDIQLKSKGWHSEDFDHVEFVSDYEVHGLKNHYHNYGLGVPLIAVRHHHEDADPREKYYPPNLSFPVTAFLRIERDPGVVAETASGDLQAMPRIETSSLATRQISAVLELRDPLDEDQVRVAENTVPLETDLSTPLAHYLNQPALEDGKVSTAGLLKPEKVAKLSGLYMLEPFRADKIPVVMVHGLWSSPVTWMEMFNDLRSDPALRNNYQFWFYLYPTGQPFWDSAAQMRTDLAKMRESLDPEQEFVALDQMVLVGHSMGGLVSRLQTIDSRDEFWKTLSDKPFSELKADPELRDQMAQTYIFRPNPSVRRVITLGTPHRGSDVANDVTRWLGRKVIKVPSMMLQRRHELIARNAGYFREDAPLGISTSIDSLSPKSPILPVMMAADVGPWVMHHNVVGHTQAKGLTERFTHWLAGEGDGVVSLESARFEAAVSEITVPADHISVHRHPTSILEVRRILRQHILELRNFPYGQSNSKVELATGQTPLQHMQPTATSLPATESPSQRQTRLQRQVMLNPGPDHTQPSSSTTAGRPPATLVR